MTINYFFDSKYEAVIYGEQEMNFKEFESCVFDNCDFSKCVFLAVTFIDCTFNNCNFNAAKINYTAFRTAFFDDCKIKEVNFAMCDKLIFEVHFKDCVLDFSKFYTLKMKRTSFTNCSLIAADFMSSDLTEVVFDNCNLHRSEFDKAIANKANFKTSSNYTIDPSKTKLKKAIFSRENIKGLLFKHNVIVVD